MGWISHFLSGAVLAGFVFGFGIGLIADQTPKILGVPKASGSYFDVLIAGDQIATRDQYTYPHRRDFQYHPVVDNA